MPRYATIEKLLRETPLQAVERYRSEAQLSATVPLAYAGRLDPMATGKLIVLIGDECKRQEQYHGFDKEYEFEILLGFSSDTYDVLGIATSHTLPHVTPPDITRSLHTLRGTHSFPYPHFSAKTVHGKPLHEWTLEGRLGEIEIPTRTMHVHRIELVDRYTLTFQTLHERIREKIHSFPEVTDPRKALGKDFRRAEVAAQWHALLATSPDTHASIIRAKAVVSAGTYIRTLTHELGARLSSGALAFSIHRTRIGNYHPLFKDYGFWTNSF